MSHLSELGSLWELNQSFLCSSKQQLCNQTRLCRSDKYRLRGGLVGGPGQAWFEPVRVCVQEEGCFLTGLPHGIKK